MSDITQYEILVLLHNRQDIKRFLQHVGELLTNYKVVGRENKLFYRGGCFRCFKIGGEVEKVKGLRYHAIIFPKGYLPPERVYANLVDCKETSLNKLMEKVCGGGLDYKLK